MSKAMHHGNRCGAAGAIRGPLFNADDAEYDVARSV